MSEEKQSDRERADRIQMRLAGAVIAVAMLVWLGFQWLGKEYALAPKYAFLGDLVAIGALVWSLLVTWRIWRRRNTPPQG